MCVIDVDFVYIWVNVIDGCFSYGLVSECICYSCVLVSYDNLVNNYDIDVVVVIDKCL